MTRVLIIDNNWVRASFKKNFNDYLVKNGKSIEVEVFNPGTWAGNDFREMLALLKKNEYDLYAVGHTVGLLRAKDIDQKSEVYGCKIKYLAPTELAPTEWGYRSLLKVIEESIGEEITS